MCKVFLNPQSKIDRHSNQENVDFLQLRSATTADCAKEHPTKSTCNPILHPMTALKITLSRIQSSPTRSNIPDQSARLISMFGPTMHPQSLLILPPQSSSAMTNNPPTASNLSNQLIGRISKYFFQHLKPNNSRPESKPSKLLIGKKQRRGVKLGPISGLTKQKDALSSSQPGIVWCCYQSENSLPESQSTLYPNI
ncbi:hypothetical protein PGT21_010280 [Puccinia graminis f. sp. tritici]|uniref:Uncharacterized protein n=1 Tax=Puccinia graminis f. sp. tritici TaxID=56615 RepID=A0A5B0MNA6_PUCGR|nr:hypothetical protein PGT21_010280 [Puccinia graminis f. sp. tritici]